MVNTVAIPPRTSTLFGADGRRGSSFVDAVLAREADVAPPALDFVSFLIVLPGPPVTARVGVRRR